MTKPSPTNNPTPHSTEGAGAPEITPAMVEAGIEALWSHDPDDRSREIVRAVFIAMRAAEGSRTGEASWLR